MKIVTGWPPNIDRIREVLPTPAYSVFAYGDVIYSPSGPDGIDLALVAHEETHRRQQESVGGPEVWWERYLSDVEFRLSQEVEAYRAQYQAASLWPRDARKRLLVEMSRMLAGPMYGGLVTRNHARGLIQRG